MENQKHLFRLPPDLHYLNCAYKAPLLRSAEEAAVNALKRLRNPASLTPDDFFSGVEKVRMLFSRIAHCHPGRVAVIPSVSYGMSSVFQNIKGEKGKHAITIYHEFPSGYFSVKRWCARHGCDLKIIAPHQAEENAGRNWNDRIIHSINDHTALVVMSSVHWIHGVRFDLEEIGRRCREVGAIFIVDGTQSVGALPIDVEKYHIDALVCAGYKWLMGPFSLGYAYLGPTFDNGIPLEESWMNRTNARDFNSLTDYNPDYLPAAARYNMGEASHFILVPMAVESLGQILEWGVPEIQKYCGELIRPLIAYLAEAGLPLETGDYFSNHLFSLRLPEEADFNEVTKNLRDREIILSVRNNALRVAVNVFNTPDDIDALINAINVS